MRKPLIAALVLVAAPALAEKNYALTTTPPTDATVGKQTQASVKLTPGKGFHVNTEFPTAMRLNLPVEIEGASGAVKPTTIDRTQALFVLHFTPKKPGKRQLAGTVSFVMCSDDNTSCVPQRAPFTIDVNAK